MRCSASSFGVGRLSRLRVRRLQARERMLERIVDERTAALSEEVNERKRVEESLRKSRDELEDRVRERTTELSAAYAQLQQDVAQRRKLEEQLAQVQKLESIGRLAGGVAHDINNVLTVVLSYSDLVDAGLGPGHPLQAQLRQIRKAAERASNLTHRLLAFARKQIIEPRVINLSELTLNLDGMLRRLIGEDVELVTVSSAEPLVGQGRSAPDRAGAGEPRGQRPRRHAAGRAAVASRPPTCSSTKPSRASIRRCGSASTCG